MKILLFSDIHGNVDNIIDVLESNMFDEYIFAGDAFGYFSEGKKVLELFVKYKVKIILGNHDLYFLRALDPDWFNSRFSTLSSEMLSSDAYNAKYGYLYDTLEDIKSFDIEFLKKANLSASYTIANMNISVCHGSPENTFNGYIYPDYEFFDNIFNEQTFDLLILGHTHKSYIKEKEGRFIINPGSCTIPRGDHLPSYAVFETDKREASIYTIEQKINFIRETKNKLKLVNSK